MRRIATALLLGVAALAPRTGAAHELTGFIAAEYRGFWQSPLFPDQRDHQPSLVLEPEYFHEWNGGDDIITITPFFRYDWMDSRRTHFDVRELSWLHVQGDWEVLAGVSKVFWGVTEVTHLVDIVNQTDLIEDFDTEEKLGQPMVRLSWIQNWGTLSLFVLPGFRERTFPGKHGRLRPERPIKTHDAEWDSGAEWRHVDFAVRYAHTFGDWDIGLANFWGTGREPKIVVHPTRNGFDLRPHYDIINQTSLDVQATIENWLLKFEGIYRIGQGRSFFAGTGGVEYSFYSILGTDTDLGLIVEGMYDHRHPDPTVSPASAFQRDVFFGVRFGFNDVQSTELLGGGVYDLEFGNWFYFIEASRRLGDRWRLELDVRIFSNLDARDPDGVIRRDSYVQLSLARFF